jgi:D-3-phosphoglycerate dehydrogenase / 2-oxoglutarate reductase
MKILLLEPVHEDAHRLLAEAGEVIVAERLDAEYLSSAIADADAAITRGKGRLPREVLTAGKKLKAVARCGVGTDNIDVAAATELGIPVIYAPGSTTMAVAEHAMMLMLMVARRAARLNAEVKSGNWAYRDQYGMGIELRGKTLGILGLGDIGRRIAELGRGFGMKVAYWSRHSRDERFAYLERDELLRQADVLSLSVALSSETRHLINRTTLALMKPTAIIINTARGDVIDDEALSEALSSGRLAGAGIDVLAASHEQHPFWLLDNVVATPHVAAVTDVTFRQMCVPTAQEVIDIVRGKAPDPKLVRNPEVLRQ